MRNVLSLFAALPLLAGSAFGWGCEGHQMVALIARAHLTPAASAAIDRLLRENPVDPSVRRFCKDRPSDLMADTAAWADDMKPIDKTFLWHQIDIPSPISSGNIMQWCDPIGPSIDDKDRPGCIVTALPYEMEILRDTNSPPADRARALRYVIHLMGDLTQPLHVSDNHDQGGNCTRIRFFADEKLQTLHGIWDYGLIGRDLAAKKATQLQYAAMLDRDFASHWPEWGESKMDIVGWTWEAHALASSVVYADLKPSIPVASPAAGMADKTACEAERDNVEALHIFIGDEYAAQALPVIRQQLAKAGYRLAGLLNQTFR
jgi:hypothetical protein